MAKLTRRTVLTGISALGLGAIAQARDTTAVSGARWLPGNADEHWRHLVRMQMSTRSEDVPWWYTGRIYAQVGDQAPQHLYNLEGTEIYWTRELPDGSFAISGRTLTFFRDKESGEMIREFVNPFTGKTNAVAANRLGGKDGSVYSASGWRFTSEYMGENEPRPWQFEWHRAGNLAWFTSSRFSRALPQPWLESMTVFCPVDSLLDPEINNLPTHFTSTYLSPWSSWLEMGDRPGHLVWHSSGKKLESIDEIPDEYRRRVDAEHGGVLTARPESWD
ncbi:MAG: DUF1838 domain-containing protein [Gammaproteobacteria bacterium]|nr:DUF1838 domain-containing protein [Gammaproteobacteria bacterium]